MQKGITLGKCVYIAENDIKWEVLEFRKEERGIKYC